MSVMERVLTTLPLPHALAKEYGFQVIPVRQALIESHTPHVFIERGEQLLRVRNAPAMVKAAVGYAEMRGFKQALATTSGDLVDFVAAWSVLGPDFIAHSLPVFARSSKKTHEQIGAVLRALSEPQADSDEVEHDPAPVCLDRFLAEQERLQLQGRYHSNDWRRYLGDLIMGRNPALPSPATPGRAVPVALLGNLSWPADLITYIDVFGGRVVYDEWVQLAARLALASEPCKALAESPLVCGLKARLKALKPYLDTVQAIILVVEPFSASALEEAWFRREIDKPVLVIEAGDMGRLDATRLMRLENFASVALGYREGT
jgi:hypothetical protein